MRDGAANDDETDFRTESLAVLPDLLTLAREMAAAADTPGDAEIARLRELLDECVVEAHRIRLRERLADVGGRLRGG